MLSFVTQWPIPVLSICNAVYLKWFTYTMLCFIRLISIFSSWLFLALKKISKVSLGVNLTKTVRVIISPQSQEEQWTIIFCGKKIKHPICKQPLWIFALLHRIFTCAVNTLQKYNGLRTLYQNAKIKKGYCEVVKYEYRRVLWEYCENKKFWIHCNHENLGEIMSLK